LAALGEIVLNLFGGSALISKPRAMRSPDPAHHLLKACGRAGHALVAAGLYLGRRNDKGVE